jgi:hypothetical protein
MIQACRHCTALSLELLKGSRWHSWLLEQRQSKEEGLARCEGYVILTLDGVFLHSPAACPRHKYSINKLLQALHHAHMPRDTDLLDGRHK